MSANQVVKKNLSGMQVIKTLQVLMEGNYTMADLIKELNKNEKKPIFNNSVVSKYINTCRYIGFEIPKIQNKYFVAKLPFGLNLSLKEQKLLEYLQAIAVQKLTSKPNRIFETFIARLNKYSNKDIVRVEKNTPQIIHELFDKAIQEKRRVLLMFKTKDSLNCTPLAMVDYKGKSCFKVFYNGKIKHISVERISGLELLGKTFISETNSEIQVIFKLKGRLAERYALRDNETLISSNLPNDIVISNSGEDKDDLLSRLLRYDKNCEIIKPLEYRKEMKVLLNNMLANYGE